MQKILEKLCLYPVITVRKRRKYWQIDNTTITLDEVESLGSFVEVEREGGLEEVNEVTKLAELIAPDGERVEKTYLEMLLERVHKK
jgi:adenylate cyclase class 2